MSDELKPCPFCGGEAHFIKVEHAVGVWYTVCCDDAECFGHEQSRLYTLRRLAAEAWNRRADECDRYELNKIIIKLSEEIEWYTTDDSIDWEDRIRKALGVE